MEVHKCTGLQSAKEAELQLLQKQLVKVVPKKLLDF